MCGRAKRTVLAGQPRVEKLYDEASATLLAVLLAAGSMFLSSGHPLRSVLNKSWLPIIADQRRQRRSMRPLQVSLENP